MAKNSKKKLWSQNGFFIFRHQTIKIFMVSGKLHFFNVFLPILVYDSKKWTFIFVHFRLAVPNMSKKQCKQCNFSKPNVEQCILL